MKLRKKLALVLALVLAVTVLYKPVANNAYKTANADETDTFEDLSQNEIVAAMGAGWNLGNQLEATNGDGNPILAGTGWTNIAPTPTLFKAVKNAGFDTVRIPVSYLNYVEGNSTDGYYIKDEWMAYVKSVVQMAIDADLFVIVNMHGDGYNSVFGSWLLCNDTANQNTIKKKYADAWADIADNLKEFDEHLIFESMNEEFDGTNYDKYVAAYYDNIMAYNQIFVDTVRASEGNNAKRWLLVPGWNTNIDLTTDSYFNPPTDAANRIMISVHFYDPYDFTDSAGESTWDGNTHLWATTSYMTGQFQKLYNRFVSNGYPVVIGEYGCTAEAGNETKDTASRVNWTTLVCELSQTYGCVPVWWDNGSGFKIIDRSSCQVTDSNIVDAIFSVYDGENGGGAELSGGDEVLWSGSQDITWEVGAITINSAAFYGYINATLTLELTPTDSGSGSNLALLTMGWSDNGRIDPSVTASTTSITINVDDYLDNLTEKGLIIFGNNITVTKVTLTGLKPYTIYSQTTEVSNGTYAKRWVYLISTEDIAKYEYANLVLTRSGSVNGQEVSGSKTVKITSCYNSVSAAGTTITAPNGYKFLAYAMTDIPSSGDDQVNITATMTLVE